MRAPCHRDKISVKRSTTTTAITTTSLLMAVEMGLFFSFGQSFHCAVFIFHGFSLPRQTHHAPHQRLKAKRVKRTKHCHICCSLIFFSFRCVSTYKTGNNETIKIQLNGKAKCKLFVHFSSAFSLLCYTGVLTILDLIRGVVLLLLHAQSVDDMMVFII